MYNKIIKNYHVFYEFPWPFLTLDAVLFFYFSIKGLDLFSLSITNFLISSDNLKTHYIYDIETRKAIFSLSKEIKGIEEIKEFLGIFNLKLKSLEKKEKKFYGKNTVLYYDVISNDFFCYDYKQFNELLYINYINEFFFKKILFNNKFYLDLSFFIDLVYQKYNYTFIDSSLSVFDIKIFFFKALRFSRNDNKFFDIKKFIDFVVVNFKLFDSNINVTKVNIFFKEILESLNNNDIFIFDKEEKIFEINENYNFEEVLGRSFQPIILGYSEILDSFESKFYIDSTNLFELSKEYKNSSVKKKIEIDDFLFFLILCSTTQAISINTSINNIFYETILERLKKP